MAQALFNETLFPKCPDMRQLGYISVADLPVGQQGEYNIPPDDENEEFGGSGNGHGLPPIPPPQGTYQPYNNMPPAGPSAPPSTGESTDPHMSYGDEQKTPPVPREPTPPVPQEQPELFDYDEDYSGLAFGRGADGGPAFFGEPRRVPRPMATPEWPQQLNFPRAPPHPPRQPQFESGPMPTRQSERTRVPASRLDNVYGDRAPADILDEDNDTFFSPGGDQRPGSSGSHAENLGVSFDTSQTNITAKIAQERGAKLINLLLNKAAIKPFGQASGELPNVHNVREWHYRDLMRFPEAAQKEWKTVMLEELELLQKWNVFELTNLSKGRKSIGCRWVFDIKTDGQKKARLVAQGFSQVEGIDFNKLFPPVVRFESMKLSLLLPHYTAGI